ncbi:hypothetical protein BGZ83_004177 [Gryganskiella cystojenkinii]|nr:hypothetical protein BGZ83_004177 [Gryganskiella cystojenkinii]
MSEQEEKVFSTESEPRVEIVEEVQPDGSILRKKKTTRTITKRVLTTTTKEVENSHQHHQESSSSSSAHVVSSSSSSGESTHSKAVEAEEKAEQVEKDAATTTTASSTTTTTSATATGSSSSSGSMSSRFQRRLDLTNTPLYKFLAKFPLKQSPAPHQRPRPVKPVLYAFAPGWKLAKKEKAAVESSSPSSDETEKKTAEEETRDEKLFGSFDVDSLKWMAYLKFNKIDFDIKSATEPNMSPSGKLPFLYLPDGKLITADGFEAFVQENAGSDAPKLELDQATESVAFTALAESKIHAALLYTMWFEQPHFQATTRDHYFGHYNNRLLSMLLAYQQKSEIVNTMLQTRTQIDREQIFEEAAQAIDSLSVQLAASGGDYFFGRSEPSGLDAVVFAYLHVILTMPRITNIEDAGRSGELARIVRKHENLFRYSQKIWKTWFATETK